MLAGNHLVRCLLSSTLVHRDEQRRFGAEEAKVVAIALGRLERQAVAPHQLRQLSGRHHRSRKQAHEVTFAKRRRAPSLQREQQGEQRAQGLGHPECSKRLSTESTAAYIDWSWIARC